MGVRRRSGTRSARGGPWSRCPGRGAGTSVRPPRLSGPFLPRPTDGRNVTCSVLETRGRGKRFGRRAAALTGVSHVCPVTECSPVTSPGGRESPPQPRRDSRPHLRPLGSFLCHVKEENAFPFNRKRVRKPRARIFPSAEPSRCGVFADGPAEACPLPRGAGEVRRARGPCRKWRGPVAGTAVSPRRCAGRSRRGPTDRPSSRGQSQRGGAHVPAVPGDLSSQ